MVIFGVSYIVHYRKTRQKRVEPWGGECEGMRGERWLPSDRKRDQSVFSGPQIGVCIGVHGNTKEAEFKKGAVDGSTSFYPVSSITHRDPQWGNTFTSDRNRTIVLESTKKGEQIGWSQGDLGGNCKQATEKKKKISGHSFRPIHAFP